MNAYFAPAQPTRQAHAQDSTWNPARLVAWLVCENDRLRVKVRELELSIGGVSLDSGVPNNLSPYEKRE